VEATQVSNGPQPTGDELLIVEDVKKHFPITRGVIFQKEVASVKAVDGVRAPRCGRSGAR
jgi:oligopeptide transport system ATP-binding protein